MVVKNTKTSVVLTKTSLSVKCYKYIILYSFCIEPVCILMASPNAIAPLIEPAKAIIPLSEGLIFKLFHLLNIYKFIYLINQERL